MINTGGLASPPESQHNSPMVLVESAFALEKGRLSPVRFVNPRDLHMSTALLDNDHKQDNSNQDQIGPLFDAEHDSTFRSRKSSFSSFSGMSHVGDGAEETGPTDTLKSDSSDLEDKDDPMTGTNFKTIHESSDIDGSSDDDGDGPKVLPEDNGETVEPSNVEKPSSGSSGEDAEEDLMDGKNLPSGLVDGNGSISSEESEDVVLISNVQPLASMDNRGEDHPMSGDELDVPSSVDNADDPMTGDESMEPRSLGKVEVNHSMNIDSHPSKVLDSKSSDSSYVGSEGSDASQSDPVSAVGPMPGIVSTQTSVEDDLLETIGDSFGPRRSSRKAAMKNSENAYQSRPLYSGKKKPSAKREKIVLQASTSIHPP
jgi:hypothetical protein